MREIIVFYWGGGYAKLCRRGRTAWTARTVRRLLARMRTDNTSTQAFKNVMSATADGYTVKALHHA